MNELISVIVPIYKVENYLKKCIDSLINQTYENLEIILVDDGSPDNCGAICDRYAEKDSRVRVIHKQNGGLSDARNAGLDVCTGDFVMFVDSDDWISTDMCEVLLKECIKNNADISSCYFRCVYDDDKLVDEACDRSCDVKVVARDEALETIIFNSDVNEDSLVAQMAWGKLYSAELFRTVRFPYGKVHEDEFTTYKVVDMANKCVVVPSQKYFYLKRDNSIMGKPKKIENYLCTIQAFEERYEHFKNKNRHLAECAFIMLISVYLVSYADSFKLSEESQAAILRKEIEQKLDGVKLHEAVKFKKSKMVMKVVSGLLIYKLNKRLFVCLRNGK